MVTGNEILSDDEPEAIGGRKSPLRRCIVTGTVQPKDGMVRFVLAPDGSVVPDLEERLPGRGYWVGADRALLERALAKGSFSRAARRQVPVDPGLPDRVAERLKARCLDALGLARRAGEAVAGFEKVREALRQENVAVLLAATDGAEDGKAKLRALAAHAARPLPLVELFASAELGSALGRDIAVHAAIAPGRLAERLAVECRRYAGFATGRMEELMSGPVAGRRNGTAS